MATDKNTAKTDTITAPHVYQAIAAITAQMATDGISKNHKNQQQGYNFRGIDDVYNALAPMLAENSLCILPEMLTREVTERTTAKGGVLFYVTVEANFNFISAKDGSKHVVKTFGEAMDSADKATNKAMSAAYKYACIQAFCIPTVGDNDADAVTHEIKPEKPSLTPEQEEAKKFIVGIKGKILEAKAPEDISFVIHQSIKDIQEKCSKAQQDHINDFAAQRAVFLSQAPLGERNGTSAHN